MKSATKRKETFGSETPISQKKLPPKVLCEEIEINDLSKTISRESCVGPMTRRWEEMLRNRRPFDCHTGSGR